jgi:hypothetical protein
LILALISRFIKKQKIGIGPEPLINNIGHKKALSFYGINAETFVNHLYYITDDFDIVIARKWSYLFFLRLLFSYKAIFIYFNGGLLSFAPFNNLIKLIEPLFYKSANIKVIVMPYGGDVQNFNYYNDVVYKDAYNTDYPRYVRIGVRNREKNVKRWIKYGDWIVAGCDWVNYLPYWDTLMLAHFMPDNKKWYPKDENPLVIEKFNKMRPLRILHAPNHKAMKGTYFIEKIIKQLEAEKYPVEYHRIQKIPNNELVAMVQNVDIVIDQMVIGWYGMFALEAMSCRKPVMIYINDDLEKLYTMHGLIELNELPFIKIDYNNIKQRIIEIINNPNKLNEAAENSYNYVNKYHSCEYIGLIFKNILDDLGCL